MFGRQIFVQVNVKGEITELRIMEAGTQQDSVSGVTQVIFCVSDKAELQEYINRDAHNPLRMGKTVEH